MIGKRVEWHLRGRRLRTDEEKAFCRKHGVEPRSEFVEAYSAIHVDRLFGFLSNERLAPPDHWHESDQAFQGTVQGWSVNEATLLIERSDGAWIQVPVDCVKSVVE